MRKASGVRIDVAAVIVVNDIVHLCTFKTPHCKPAHLLAASIDQPVVSIKWQFVTAIIDERNAFCPVLPHPVTNARARRVLFCVTFEAFQ
jgi:hypothetical protein